MSETKKMDFVRNWLDTQARPSSSNTDATPLSRRISFAPGTGEPQGHVLRDADTHWVGSSRAGSSSKDTSAEPSPVQAGAKTVDNIPTITTTASNNATEEESSYVADSSVTGSRRSSLLRHIHPHQRCLPRNMPAKLRQALLQQTQPDTAEDCTARAESGCGCSRPQSRSASQASRGVYGAGSLPGIPGFDRGVPAR